ncbi:MAG: GNAT family N-acetyltransferase [Oscillospiraceae bacterium]|nr:GNAT family N-acetyltransferase [Oscillospiraceae bacterium]
MITIRPVDENSVEACASLQCTPEQRQFTNSPIWSLLETAYTPLRQHCGLYAIYSGETVVGMVRLDFTLHEGYYEFTNLLIDREHQRKRCAAEAIRQIIEVFRRDGRFPLLRIHVAPENAAAIRLYEKLGFTYAHNTEDQVFRVYEYPL